MTLQDVTEAGKDAILDLGEATVRIGVGGAGGVVPACSSAAVALITIAWTAQRAHTPLQKMQL